MREARAFTLVEALVAIAVLVAAMLGPVALLARVIGIAPHTQAQAQAAALAREPIAYLTHLRDRDFEAAVNYLTTPAGQQNPYGYSSIFQLTLNSCLSTTCLVDPIAEEVRPCAPDTSCRITYSSTRGYFSHQNNAGWDPTPYSRWIEVQKASDQSYRVRSVVRFVEREQPRTVTFERAIYPLAEAAVELYASFLQNP